MSLSDLFSRKGYYLGPIAGTWAWVVIFTCAHLNPWWSVTSLALSYLGASGAGHVDPWLYNAGMVSSGLLIVGFAFYLTRIARNRTQRFGSAHFLLAGILLIGIGIWHQGPGPYPPGTSPSLGQNLHDLFSAWFFLQALLAGLTWGVGLRREGRLAIGAGMIDATLGAWGVAIGLALAFGPWTGASPAHSHLLQQAGEGGIAIGVPLAVVGGLLAARAGAESRREGWGTYLLMVGALFAGIGVIAGFGSIPGAVGEVIGILAVDVWVFVMFFARDARPYPYRTEPSPGALLPEEKPVLKQRRSLLHAFQVPAMASVLAGMFLFFYASFYLNEKLVGLILGSVKISTVVGPVLALYLAGYLLVVAGAWRWSVALPRWAGAALLVAVILLPLVMIASWFDTAGDLVMLEFFLGFALLVPLALSLLTWWRQRYTLTDLRVLSTPAAAARERSSLVHRDVTGLYVRRGLFHRWFNVGDLVFSTTGGEHGHPVDRRSGRLEWTGIVGPHELLQSASEALHVGTVRPRRRRLRPGVLLVATAIVVPLVLIATLVPVLTVTTTVELPCAFLLSNLQTLESDPWPFIHNTTLPVGKVSFRWWSGADVYLLVGQLPVGLAYQNVPLNTSSGSLPTGLSSSGSGNYTSYGGDSFMACISLTSGATVSMELTYASPLVWS